MRVASALLVAMVLAFVGCDASTETNTTPKALTITPEQGKAIAEADKKIAEEENANPTKPGKAAKTPK